MKKQSYKIKHDFLFDVDDTPIDILKNNLAVSNISELNVSDVLNAKDLDSFVSLIDFSARGVLIKDDIGECINPAAERYKQFIIRCVYHKLSDLNINAYI